MSIETSIEAESFVPSAAPNDLVEFNRVVLHALADAGWTFPPVSVDALRNMAFGEPYYSPAMTRTIPAPDGEILVRIIPSAAPTEIYLHFHGGGWTIGGADHQDAVLEDVVAKTGLTVVSVDYRLAPEHPYPAGLNDCEWAARWVIDHAQDEFGARSVVIAGESAGANLALATLLRLRGDSAARSVVGASLLYGNYDVTMTPSQRRADASTMISRDALAWFYDQYAPEGVRRDAPDISPLYADLAGLPPTPVAVGTADSLIDDSLFLACRLWQAGVDCKLLTLPGAEHAFDTVPLPSVRAAMDAILQCVTRFVAP